MMKLTKGSEVGVGTIHRVHVVQVCDSENDFAAGERVGLVVSGLAAYTVLNPLTLTARPLIPDTQGYLFPIRRVGFVVHRSLPFKRTRYDPLGHTSAAQRLIVVVAAGHNPFRQFTALVTFGNREEIDRAVLNPHGEEESVEEFR